MDNKEDKTEKRKRDKAKKHRHEAGKKAHGTVEESESRAKKDTTKARKRISNARDQTAEKDISETVSKDASIKPVGEKQDLLKATKRLKEKYGNDNPKSKESDAAKLHNDSSGNETMMKDLKKNEVSKQSAPSNIACSSGVEDRNKKKKSSEQAETSFTDEPISPETKTKVDKLPQSTLQSKVGKWLDDIRVMEFKNKVEEAMTKSRELPPNYEVECKRALSGSLRSARQKSTDVVHTDANAQSENVRSPISSSLPSRQKGSLSNGTKSKPHNEQTTGEPDIESNIENADRKIASNKGKSRGRKNTRTKSVEEREPRKRTRPKNRRRTHSEYTTSNSETSDEERATIRSASMPRKAKECKHRRKARSNSLSTKQRRASDDENDTADDNTILPIGDNLAGTDTAARRKQKDHGDSKHKSHRRKHKHRTNSEETKLSANEDKKRKHRKKYSSKERAADEVDMSQGGVEGPKDENTKRREKEKSRKRKDKSKHKRKKRSHHGKRRRRKKKTKEEEEEEDLTEYFCVYHMTKFTGKAEGAMHDECDDVITAESWDEGQKLEARARVLEARHPVLVEMADTMGAERKHMVAALEDNYDQVEEQYLDKMESYIAHLLCKQREFATRLEERHSAQLKILDDQIYRCKMVRKNVKAAITELNGCRSPLEEQAVSRRIESKYPVYVEILRREFSDSLNCDYQFTKNPQLEQLLYLHSIGNFYGYEQPANLPKFPEPTDDTKKFQKYLKDIFIHNAEEPDDEEICCFSGCCFTPNGALLLADWNNSCIKMVTTEGVLQQTLKLPSDPWDIKYVNENKFAVTVPADKTIHIIECSDTTMEMTSSFETDSECFGLGVFGESIYVTCNLWSKCPTVQVFSLTGKLLSTLKDTEMKSPEYIEVEPVNRALFISESINDTVLAVTFAGRELFRYEHPELQYPAGIALDSDGNIWICGKDSGNVHQITNTGELIQIVMEDNCHMESPRAICFDPKGHRLVVTESDIELNGDFLCAKYE